MTSNLLSFVGWTFLPSLVSGWVQTVYYGITIRAGDPKPQPGTPRYQKHRMRIQMSCIILYLLYTLFEADHILRQEGDFYQTLGVPLTADDKQIKSRFRRLAAVHHPDKLTTDDPRARAAADATFVEMKKAQDTLSDPVRRFAYNRFGPDMLEWQHCVTMQDYIQRGAMQAQGPIYGGAIAVMLALSFTNYLSAGRFWRWVVTIAMAALEAHTITRPYFPPLLNYFVNPLLAIFTRHPPLLPYQLLILLRKASFTLFIAVNQASGLFPHLSMPPELAPASTNTAASAQEAQQLIRLEQIAKASDIEASRLLAMDMAPFIGDEQGVKELQGRVRDWLVNNTIRSDPEVKDAMGRVLGRKRTQMTPHIGTRSTTGAASSTGRSIK